MPKKNLTGDFPDLEKALAEWGECKGAAAKLAFIQAYAPQVGKTGRNTHQQFDYMQEHGLLAVLRPFQRLLKVAVLIDALPETVVNDGNRIQACFDCWLYDTEQPAGSDAERVGRRIVIDTTDKQGWGGAKLMTYAEKFGLQKLLHIPTEDLPESEAEAVPHERAAPKPARQVIDPETAAGLTGALRGLSESNPKVPALVMAKLQSYGVGHVKDLPADQVADFQAWVEGLS